MAFVGQVASSSLMSYNMMKMKSEMSQMETMDHSMHSMHDMMMASENSDSKENCCLDECACYLTGCSVVALQPDKVSDEATKLTNYKIDSHYRFAESQYPSSLFRPPIIS